MTTTSCADGFHGALVGSPVPSSDTVVEEADLDVGERASWTAM
jgi:hypothetical protein